MTINFFPDDYSSVHDDLLYTLYDAHVEDRVTYPNYKYIADVYVNGVMVERVKKFPLPPNNFGVFNVGTIVRSYVMAIFNPDIAASSILVQQMGQDNFNVEVQVKFGEEYSYTSFYNVVEDDVRTFFNHYNKKHLGVVKTEIIAVINDVASNAPLTRY